MPPISRERSSVTCAPIWPKSEKSTLLGGSTHRSPERGIDVTLERGDEVL